MPLNPLPTFDCLYLGSQLQRQLDGFSPAELHLISYLACLLSLYRRTPTSDWGYNFVSTELGAPFSREIEVTASELSRRGFFSRVHEQLQMTRIAEERLVELQALSLFQERSECLKAASASIVAFSLGTVREALWNEPELRRAKSLRANRTLLEEPGLGLIYEEFGFLREALGGHSVDLRLPAVVWLTALFRSGGDVPA